MVLLTFLTKDIHLLRVLGILGNVAFIVYGVLAYLPPVLGLHFLLLPINVLRLRSLLVEEGLPAAGSCWSTITKFCGAGLPRLALADRVPPRHRQRAGQLVGAAQAVRHGRGSDVCLFAMQPAWPMRARLINAGDHQRLRRRLAARRRRCPTANSLAPITRALDQGASRGFPKGQFPPAGPRLRSIPTREGLAIREPWHGAKS